MAERSDPEATELVNEQAVASKWSFMRSELNQLHSKITELEMELSEHALVIGAIKPLDQSRKCFRMIGGVLVERTVGEVLPAVQRNKEGIEDVIKRLVEALEKKKREIAEFEAKYKIKIRRAEDVASEEQQNKQKQQKQQQQSGGVLVGGTSA